MKKRIFYLVNIFFIFSLQVLALNFTNSKEIEKIFQENQVKGTFVLYNPQIIVSQDIIKKEQKKDFTQHPLLKYIIP